MAPPDTSDSEPPPPCDHYSVLQRLLGRENVNPYPLSHQLSHDDNSPHPSQHPQHSRHSQHSHPDQSHPHPQAHSNSHSQQQSPLQSQPDTDNQSRNPTNRRPQRPVIPGFPRSQTLKRQFSERRDHLMPVDTSMEERRAASVEQRSGHAGTSSQFSEIEAPQSHPASFGASSYDDFRDMPLSASPMSATFPYEYPASLSLASRPDVDRLDAMSFPTPSMETQSLTTSQYDARIRNELEKEWILNLSMHFRDQSKREKFFVTYRRGHHQWYRVTISIDYRNAPPDSLEAELAATKSQREKSARIYEAIRLSLHDIPFLDTVTNLKLQTIQGQLNVHVVEDGNEIIEYPSINCIKHLGCRKVKERDIVFDSHMSGFVYKVFVGGKALIKKEIPSPDTVEAFLYEINALNALQFSPHVIQLEGVVVDDSGELVKGLLISYAEQGALVDIIYDNCKETVLGIRWSDRERWAQQIIRGLADIHESGFVQGDFTLSNVVIDEAGDAKIIDINRRGCPVKWEPPEASALVESNQRLTLFIGEKSDLYQLGMVLWALAMEEDEPENQGRPLMLGPEINIPDWYRQITENCLSNDPRSRMHAISLLQMMPPLAASDSPDSTSNPALPNNHSAQTGRGGINGSGAAYENKLLALPNRQYQQPLTYDPLYTARGRSPPSPMPSNSSRDRLNRLKMTEGRGGLMQMPNGHAGLPAQAPSHRQFIPTPDHDSPLGRGDDIPKSAPRSQSRHSIAESAGDGAKTPKVDENYPVPNIPSEFKQEIPPEDGRNTGLALELLNTSLGFKVVRKALPRRATSPGTKPRHDEAQNDDYPLLGDSEQWGETRPSVASAPAAAPAASRSAIPAWISDVASRTSTPDIDIGGGANLRSETADSIRYQQNHPQPRAHASHDLLDTDMLTNGRFDYNDLRFKQLELDDFHAEQPPHDETLGNVLDYDSLDEIPGHTLLDHIKPCSSKEQNAMQYIEQMKAASAARVGLDGRKDDDFTRHTGPRLPAY